MLFFLCTAPVLKLINNESSLNETAELECTSTCGSIIAWTVHAEHVIGNSKWYDTISKKKMRNKCTETITLTSTWPASVDTLSVQCIAVSLCSVKTHTFVQSTCLSEIQGVCLAISIHIIII